MKDKFVYLVYCNTEPIVYGVYESKQDAVRYAVSLIRYRKNKAKQQGKEFGYYHFRPFVCSTQIKWMKDPNCPYYHDVMVFTTCLRIPEDKKVNYGFSDEGCMIQVVRKILN